MYSLKTVGRALSWSAVDMLVKVLLNFAVLVVLARLLSPEDFGFIAMLAIFVAVGQLFVESGFSQALIQRQQVTTLDESTIFYFTLMVAGVFAICLCLFASLISEFYGYPILEELTYWMALNLIVSSFGVIHTTLLIKKLDFKTIAKVGVVATLISSAVALFMAAKGWGVWSLIGQTLANTTLTVIMLWLFHSWRPVRGFNVDTIKSYFSFGGFLLWTGTLNILYKNLHALLIGKMYTPLDVGYYTQARRLQQYPIDFITIIIGRVSFPVYARIADDKQKLALALDRATAVVVFITLPIMFQLMVFAEPVVLFFFGEKWLPIAPIVEALAIAGVMAPLNALNLNVLKAQGYAALNAKIQLIRISIAVALLLLTSPMGIVAIAYGQALASFLSFFVNAHYSKVFLDYGARLQIRCMLPYLVSTMFMALVMKMFVMGDLLDDYNLAIASALGLLTYLFIAKLAGFRALADIMVILNPKKSYG